MSSKYPTDAPICPTPILIPIIQIPLQGSVAHTEPKHLTEMPDLLFLTGISTFLFAPPILKTVPDAVLLVVMENTCGGRAYWYPNWTLSYFFIPEKKPMGYTTPSPSSIAYLLHPYSHSYNKVLCDALTPIRANAPHQEMPGRPLSASPPFCQNTEAASLVRLAAWASLPFAYRKNNA